MSIKDKKRILTDWYREHGGLPKGNLCLLYTSDAADE